MNPARTTAGFERGLVTWALGVVLLACATTTLGASGEYRTFEVESLRIEFDSEWGMRTAPGYLPVRFDITNLGQARVIEIYGQGSRYFRAGRGMVTGASEVSQSVRLARGDRVRLTIPVPIFGNNESIRFEIRENGTTLERLTFTGFQGAATPADASALIVADRSSATGLAASGWLRPLTAAGPTAFVTSGARGPITVKVPGRAVPGATAPPLDFMLPPSRLPTNWLGYSSLRAVVVGPTEWQQMTDAQKSALLAWTACGGDLVFVDGNLEVLLPGAAPSPAGDGVVRAYLFGRIHRPTAASLTAKGMGAFLADARRLQDSNLALPANTARDWGAIAARGFRLPIPGVEGIPARAYVGILLVFSLIIGPANYWFLRRHGQQVLLVLTAPLISAGFIVLLGVYVVAGEGLGVRGRIASFTMLDQARSQAVTRSSLSLYAAGMAPSGGLRLPRDVAIFPIGTDGSGTRDRIVLDLSETQRFPAGVIQARAATNLEQIAFRPARERLAFARENGALTVTNGLGSTVAALFYREGSAVYALSAALAPGAKSTIKAGGRSAATVVPADLPLSARFLHLAQNQPDGSYLAVLDRSPFVEPGVANVSERGSFHLVLGWPGGQP